MNAGKIIARLQQWLLTNGPRILGGIVLLLIGLWLISLIKKWLHRRLLEKELNSSLRPFLVNVVITAMYVVLLLGFMQVTGIQMTIFAALIGAFGVAAGLALSGTLQNFTSGILILILKPFEVGDNIVGQGMEGRVTSIQLFYTILLTFDNRTVIIPNSKLSNELIVNLSREGTRRIDIEIKFSFNIPYETVRDSIEKSLDQLPGGIKEPPHRIGISQLQNDGYTVSAQIWGPAHGFEDMKRLLNLKIVEDLLAAGVKLPGL